MKEFTNGRWFVSTVAIRVHPPGTCHVRYEHGLHIYEGFRSEDEARGRASRVMEETYPQNDGWRHDIMVRAYDAPGASPENGAKAVPS